ncbi:glutamate--cysteine ligase [Gryllotalpicola koreensis]|uniref:Putative glutamate--cysteine ligase 2 n=1 Tax=Gryllotalpicola koreensis TaxID=993086 RepID=A0ABP8ACE7_9MICO
MTISFARSGRSTVGLEWELMLADARTGDLVPAAPAILDELGAHLGITGELLTNTVEVISEPRSRVADAVADLRLRIDTVRMAAHLRDVVLLSSGSHPFARWNDQQITQKTRYHTLVERTQWWGRNMMIWGIHVHIGVDDVRKVIPIVDELTTYLPHLQALSASSPFWAGEETGYASNRALVFQQLPTAGLPWALGDWADFERYVADLVHTGVIDDVTEVRWDVRPAPRWGTIEVRACDAVSNPLELSAIAALVQCLVEWISRRLDAGEQLRSLPPWFHRENKWRAARYGMDVITISDADARELTVREHLRELLPVLEPIAADLGCLTELAGVHDILAVGAGYQRQLRAAHAAGGDLRAVVRHLIAEFDAERPLAP